MKKILFAASECHPFASSGGLGEVIGSLPEALHKEYKADADIRVVMPLYGTIDASVRRRMTKLGEINVPLAWRNQYCGIYSLQKRGVTYYFIDNEYYFNRRTLYGHYDDGERFAFFSKAVLEIMPHIGFFPDILHCHDWQTALAIVYLNCKYNPLDGYDNIQTVFTIHNIAYQGIYNPQILGDVFDIPEDKAVILDYNGDINLMKGAIVSADKISTVSPTYAREILSPKFSHGLHYVLEQNKSKITGILNGIDRDYYNPAKDKEIACNYSWRDMEGKAKNKETLQKTAGLPVKPDTPVISIVSRLVDHKGLDLVTLAADDLLKEDIQLVILGKGDYYYENFFVNLSEKYPDKVSVSLVFDKAYSKQIYAGSDIFLMPSRSEPCGLSQMIASRYGTIPVVRETGGLYDSIKDIGWQGGGNGFTFAPYSAWELLQAVRRATDCYRDREYWNNLAEKVMRVDFSWKKSAKEYIRLLYS